MVHTKKYSLLRHLKIFTCCKIVQRGLFFIISSKLLFFKMQYIFFFLILPKWRIFALRKTPERSKGLRTRCFLCLLVHLQGAHTTSSCDFLLPHPCTQIAADGFHSCGLCPAQHGRFFQNGTLYTSHTESIKPWKLPILKGETCECKLYLLSCK